MNKQTLFEIWRCTRYYGQIMTGNKTESDDRGESFDM